MYIPPKRLRRGSKVAIVAPSSPIVSDRLSFGIDLIREAGLIPVLGPCVKYLRSDGVHSAPLADRVAELDWAFKDTSISGIICAVGGIGSAGLLPHLDYNIIKRGRKPFLGRSDISALNCGILAKAGLITINGQTPSIKVERGQAIIEQESNSFMTALEMMMSGEIWGQKPFENNHHIPRTVSPGRAQGHVIGCNADTYSRLLGTPYFPDPKGAILFIEDVHKTSHAIGREMLHLKLAGVLDQVAGVVIGEFIDCEKKTSERMPEIEDVIQEYFSEGPPCVYGYPFSHGYMTAPIPVGGTCFLDADSCEVTFKFSMH